MKLAAIHRSLSERPEGVLIRLVNGHESAALRQDCISFNPAEGARRGGSSFIVWEADGPVLINTLLVAEVTPLKSNGRGGRRAKRRRSA
jgi:hypothetical protein